MRAGHPGVLGDHPVDQEQPLVVVVDEEAEDGVVAAGERADLDLDLLLDQRVVRRAAGPSLPRPSVIVTSATSSGASRVSSARTTAIGRPTRPARVLVPRLANVSTVHRVVSTARRKVTSALFAGGSGSARAAASARTMPGHDLADQALLRLAARPAGRRPGAAAGPARTPR